MVMSTTTGATGHRVRSARRGGRTLALAATLALAGTGLGLGPVHADEIFGAITDVSVTPGPIRTGQQVTTTIDWCVPNGTSSGDHFTLLLSEHLRNVPTGFTLTDGPGGPVVANVSVTGDIPNQVATFYLTSYAETALNVCGTAFLQTDTSNQMPAGEVDFDFVDGEGTVFGNPVTVLPSTPQAGPVKVGRFENSDQGHSTSDNVLSWRLTGPAGPVDTVTYRDNPPDGQLIDCPATASEILIGTRTPNATLTSPRPYTGGTLTCTPDAVTFVSGPIAAGEAVQIRVFVDLVAPTGAGSTTFTNTAEYDITAQGQTTTVGVPASLTQNNAGGNGNGDGVTIQKWTTVDGYPAGDFDSAPGKIVAPRTPTAVTATVTNTGPNALTLVQISDINGAGPTITGLVCTFPDGSVGTVWPGPWAVGTSFPCTGTVPGMEPGTVHDDTMVVTAVGNGPVFATDPLHLTTAGTVSVGDLVWNDHNGNGVQDAGEPGIPNVVLTLTGPDGPVTDVFGNPVGPTRTGPDGTYTFDNLPILPPGVHYAVTVTPPAGLIPTLPGVGDRSTDSSTGSAASVDLTTHGARDDTLDFGFFAAVPAVTIVKGDENGNAADTPDAAVELLTGATGLVFTVTNTGNEPLVAVEVTDEVTGGGGSVANLTCTFPDGSVGTSWAGPFAVGASFGCTAALSGVVADGDPHVDVATVTGNGQWSGLPVEDDDPYHAIPPILVESTTSTPPSPTTQTTTSTSTTATSTTPTSTTSTVSTSTTTTSVRGTTSRTALASTGVGQSTNLVLPAGLLVLVGAALVLLTVRRRSQQH